MKAKSPYKINWHDLFDVIAYAKTLGPGMVVYKHPERSNYNITFASNTERYKPKGCVVLHRT